MFSTRSTSTATPGRSERRRAVYRRRRLIAAAAAAALAFVLFAVIVVVRFESESTPALQAVPVMVSQVTFPGPKPSLAWPSAGQAAVTVGGLGTLGTSGSPTPVPIASVAKVMTAYVILHDFPEAAGASGFQLTVTSDDVEDTDERADEAQSVVPVAEGEVLTEYQLLEGLLIPSANNFAAMLAAYDAGTSAAFVAKMNATARSLGMTSTNYTDPSGFDPTTVSTAADQTILAQAAMGLPTFAAVVAEKTATLPYAGKVTNFDHIVGTDGFLGIKTGSDSTAGGSFVFADQRSVSGHQVTIYGAVLGQDVGERATNPLVDAAERAAEQLADSATASLSVKTVVAAGTPVLTVANAQHKVVTVSTTTALVRLGWGGMQITLHLAAGAVGKRLAAGQVVGVVTGGSAGPGRIGSGETEIVAQQSMPALSLGWKIDHIF